MTVTNMGVDASRRPGIVAGETIAALQPGRVKVKAGDAREALQIVNHRQVDAAMLESSMSDFLAGAAPHLKQARG